MILGTAAYMAPEQAKADRSSRQGSDVWAFGVILHETLTGERTFAADTVGESIAAVLTREPDLSRAPMRARRLLHACLQKDPRKRLRDIGDAQILLDSAEDTPAPTSRRGLVPWVVATLVIGAVAAGAAMWRVRSAPPQIPFVFHEPAPEGTRLIVSTQGVTRQPIPGDPRGYCGRTAADLDASGGRREGEAARGDAGGERGVLVARQRRARVHHCWRAVPAFLEAEGRGSVWRRQIRPRRGRRLVCGRRRARLIVAGPSGMFRVSADGGNPPPTVPRSTRGVRQDSGDLAFGPPSAFPPVGWRDRSARSGSRPPGRSGGWNGTWRARPRGASSALSRPT